MKKVIALTLVLAASAFAADLNVAIQGPETIELGETGQVQVVLLGDAAASAGLLNANMLLQITPGDPVEGDLAITAATMNPALTNIGVDPVPASMAVADGYLMSFYGPYTPITADYVVFTFDVTGSVMGDITVGLYEHNVAQPQHTNRETNFNNAGGTFDGVTTPLTISVVPEPASLALLAIGGLAVIRRR